MCSSPITQLLPLWMDVNLADADDLLIAASDIEIVLTKNDAVIQGAEAKTNMRFVISDVDVAVRQTTHCQCSLR